MSKPKNMTAEEEIVWKEKQKAYHQSPERKASDSYVSCLMNITTEQARANPDLLEAKRTYLKTYRILKQIKNESPIRN